MRKTKLFTLAVLAILFFVGCSDDEETVKQSLTYVNVKFPKDMEAKNPRIETANFVLTNVNTGDRIARQVDYFPVSYFNVEDGLYNISVIGKMKYDAPIAGGGTVTKIVDVRALQENVSILGGNLNFTMEFFPVHSASNSLVISEVFFADTQTPEKKQYGGGDQYIELYNNSDKIIYADGFCIAETKLNTTMKLNEYTPDIRQDFTPVSAVYRIPGSGKDYPIKPGETLLLVDVAINHKTQNTNSFDLSKANFEWFDGLDAKDVDVPEVPNLEKIISSSRTVWHLHNRGYTGYMLFHPETAITPEQFTKEYAYHYKYHFVFGTFEKWMEFDAWKIPNSWVVDAVQCSTPSGYEWSVMSPALDISYTHSGDSDDARYGHSVKRKVAGRKNNRSILQDTNDSAYDFIATATPSPGTVETESVYK